MDRWEGEEEVGALGESTPFRLVWFGLVWFAGVAAGGAGAGLPVTGGRVTKEGLVTSFCCYCCPWIWRRP